MDRLFLDANVLFSAAWRPGAGVTRLWTLGGAELWSSSYAVEEARRNLDTPERQDRLDRLLQGVELVGAILLPHEVRARVDLPPKDLPILAGALDAGATHLITGDVRDFGAWFGRDLEGIRVMPPGRYLREVGRGG